MTIENPRPDYDTLAFRARAAVSRAVTELVGHTHGEDGFTLSTPAGFDWEPRRGPKPLPALEAALTVQAASADTAAHAVRDARTEGHSWTEIAEVLGTEPTANAYDWAIAAYERFANPATAWRGPSFWFCCRACAAIVRDL